MLIWAADIRFCQTIYNIKSSKIDSTLKLIFFVCFNFKIKICVRTKESFFEGLRTPSKSANPNKNSKMKNWK